MQVERIKKEITPAIPAVTQEQFQITLDPQEACYLWELLRYHVKGKGKAFTVFTRLAAALLPNSDVQRCGFDAKLFADVVLISDEGKEDFGNDHVPALRRIESLKNENAALRSEITRLERRLSEAKSRSYTAVPVTPLCPAPVASPAGLNKMGNEALRYITAMLRSTHDPHTGALAVLTDALRERGLPTDPVWANEEGNYPSINLLDYKLWPSQDVQLATKRGL